ncbi:hypothetical protein NEUTE1DRAFT_140941 [Neurospora tetrasperma FGSC 2508]|uniref:Uncharacterized protein n=1 Tax=Neurospora tetrasperma (strain FGSC 2508 / ATCC MYA-4615 / P0657) TaxID=510951 RepID=F8MV24_NEUT8|nr:uncharacterized protein NEUTE1DRAFT_140941 [Neurospora tetrasperma FGSC 2508]EGO54649.1 hypothetical protein NEUTE1DRAFT_140941 [Neurospora tetrasperma FGSC 2508]
MEPVCSGSSYIGEADARARVQFDKTATMAPFKDDIVATIRKANEELIERF